MTAPTTTTPQLTGTFAVDPVTGESARRNPFVRVPSDARHALTWPDGALDTLFTRRAACCHECGD